MSNDREKGGIQIFVKKKTSAGASRGEEKRC